MFQNCVETPGWLTEYEIKYLRDWCEVNVGPEGFSESNTEDDWFLWKPTHAFCFKRETDMVMFVLAHTGYCHDNLV